MSHSTSPINLPQTNSTGTFQPVFNFHNKAVLKLSEGFSLVSRLEIRNEGENADGPVMKIVKVAGLIISGIPLCIFHLFYTLYNKITDCCGKSAKDIQDGNSNSPNDVISSGVSARKAGSVSGSALRLAAGRKSLREEGSAAFAAAAAQEEAKDDDGVAMELSDSVVMNASGFFPITASGGSSGAESPKVHSEETFPAQK